MVDVPDDEDVRVFIDDVEFQVADAFRTSSGCLAMFVDTSPVLGVGKFPPRAFTSGTSWEDALGLRRIA